MNAAVALKQAKAYTDLAQLGLTSITVSGTDIILTRTDGSTAIVSVPVPKAVSIEEIELNENKEIVITLTDGTIQNLGVIPTVKGDKGEDGFSPTITEDENNTAYIYKLNITTKDSTFTTPNLKGKDGTGSGSSTVEISQEENNALVEKDDGLYVAPTDTSNFVEKEEGKGLFSGKYEDLTGTPTIPSTDGLVSETKLEETLADYAKTEDLPTGYDDTALSNRVTTIENDYLTSTDKTELTTAIATAKTEVIETILGEAVDEDFDTLKEVADWIQSDTTNSAELVTRVTNVETKLGGHTVESNVPVDAKFTDTVYDDSDVKNRLCSVEDGIANLEGTKAETNHTHNYADSSTVGGSATSAVKLDTNIAGNTSQPVYFNGGKPVAIDYTLGDACEKGVDTEVTGGSENLITSDGVNTALLSIYSDDASDITSSYTVTNTTLSADVTSSYPMGFTFKHIKIGKAHFVTIAGGKKIYNTTTSEYRTNLTVEVSGSFFAGFELYATQGGGLTTFNDVSVGLSTNKVTLTQVYIQPNSTSSYSPDSVYQFRKILMLIEN